MLNDVAPSVKCFMPVLCVNLVRMKLNFVKKREYLSGYV